MVVYYENAMCMLLKSQCLIVWQLYVESEYVIVDFKVYIQVVPGQAGGGSFKREKDLYSKERICL